eukprot:6969617-Ditylum_brightwellii.AAC.2
MKESSAFQQTNARGYTMMVAYLQILHTKMWFQIKMSAMVMNYLKKYNIWVYIDEFETKQVGSPGFLTELHLKLMDLMALKFELEQRMKQVDCNDKRIVKK